LLAEPGIKKSLATSSMLLTGQDLYRIYLPVYGSIIGLSASAIGTILAASSLAAFAVRAILRLLLARFKEEQLLAGAFYVTGACLMLMPVFQSATMLIIVSFIFGLGMGCSQPIITMLMFSNSPPGRSGETMGLRMTVVHLTRLIGPVAFGAIGTALGLASMFYLNAAMMGAAGWLSDPPKKRASDKA
jgi:MFS family permease